MRLLGGCDFEGPAGPIRLESSKTSALLAFLAVEPGPHTRHKLAALFWGEAPDEKALRNLRRALWDQRARLTAGGVEVPLLVERLKIAFRPSTSCRVDLAVFEAACAGVGRLLGERTPVGGADGLEGLARDLSLYQGELLEGVSLQDSAPFEEWLLVERERVKALACAAFGGAAELFARAGRPRSGLPLARRLVALDPWREEGHRAVMKLLWLGGEPGSALRQYDALRKILAEELNAVPTEETERLREAVRAGPPTDGSSTAVRTAGAAALAALNLPPQSTPFVGREEEVGVLLEHLRDPSCRLLTLLGTGGAGKTRLALEAARRAVATEDSQVHPSFLDGVVFVPLATVEVPSRLPAAAAAALGLDSSGTPDLDLRLRARLRGRSLLLVLDAFEHLLPGSLWVADLLRQHPGLKVLATSRERLGLREEWIMEVRGLRRTEGEGQRPGGLADAQLLFLRCARRANLRFDPTPDDLASVARICDRVEGMPLGIELAAAWARTLDAAEILDELERSFDFLVADARDVPERQRSLRAVFEQSWQGLTPADQEAFAATSVFVGGFTREAGAEVAAAEPAALARLINRSVLLREPSGRYRLHQVLRQYASEKLAADARRLSKIRRAHRGHFLGLLARPDRCGTAEVEDIRAAWQCALEDEDRDALAGALDGFLALHEICGIPHEGLESLGAARGLLQGRAGQHRNLAGRIRAAEARLLDRMARHAESARVAEEALEALAGKGCSAARAEALCTLGEARLGVATYAGAESALREALDLARRADQPVLACRCLGGLGRLHRERGDYAEAKACLREALRSAQRDGAPRVLCDVLNQLGYVASYEGRLREARGFRQRALDAARECGDRSGAAQALSGLAVIAFFQARFGEAESCLLESLSLCRAAGDRMGEARALSNLGENARERGRFGEAYDLDGEAMEIFIESGDRQGEAITRANQGLALLGLRRLGEARGHLREALAVALQIGAVPIALAIVCGFARLAVEERRHGEAAELLAFALHHPSATVDIEREAVPLIARLEGALGAPQMASAGDRAKAVDLDSVGRKLLRG